MVHEQRTTQMQNVNGVIEQLHLHRSLFMDHLGFLNLAATCAVCGGFAAFS
jgi:hypothetical protein